MPFSPAKLHDLRDNYIERRETPRRDCDECERNTDLGWIIREVEPGMWLCPICKQKCVAKVAELDRDRMPLR